MTDNQKYLDEALARAKEFDLEMEPERLRQAYMALESVSLPAEPDPAARARLRESVLASWLRLIHTLDRLLDPEFDPNDVPELHVQPPPVPGGIVLLPGADPALIPDPVARAKYEEAIAANRAKAVKYRLQVHLRRLDENIPPRAEAFIRGAYSPEPHDQTELRVAIEQAITHPPRKAALLRLLSPSVP